jgi:hypothetical protein
MDPTLQKSFCLHYPNYGQMCSRVAITQHSILMHMLNALIKAENNLMNIHDIMRIEQHGGKQFNTAQCLPFQALQRKPSGNMPMTP